MDLFLHNYIADMPGPQFLKLYGFVVLLTIVALAILLRRLDRSTRLPPPKIHEPDPYQIAFLREGEPGVWRLLILNLIQRGYLSRPTTASDKIQQAAQPPDRRHLNPIERVVYGFFTSKKSPREVAELRKTPPVQAWFDELREKLRAEEWVHAEETSQQATLLTLLSAAVILGLGGYKFAVALSKGRHNVMFLVLIAVLSVICLSIMHQRFIRSVTERGKTYLDKLTTAMRHLRGIIPGYSDTATDILLLGTSIYGWDILAGTPYDPYRQMIDRERAASTSSGGGCGGGSCGGGGGCGGGGCGGCGS